MRSIRKYLVGFSTAALVLGTIATGASVSASATQATSLPFSDIGNSSSADAITFLAQAGIVSGVGGGLYDPGAPVTRAEMAKIVVNLVGKGEVATALQNVPPSFTDASSIPSWAWGYVNVAQDMGIVTGYPDGSFKPNNPVSDVEATAMVVRAIGDNEPGIVQGNWPGNYVAAAFDLNINTGVAAYIANVPASRADIAQMAFNGAVNAATAQAITANGVTTWKATGAPLWDGGVGGYKVVTGTVTGISASNISIAGTSYNWESTYDLPASVTDASALIGVTVNALVDSSGNVSDVTLGTNQSTSQKTGTLADENTTIPSGYFEVNGNEHVVTTDYACSQGDVSASACSGNLYLLFQDGSTVQVLTYNSQSSGTVYAINVPATGLSSDSTAEVSGITANGVNDDDAVTYAVNSDGKATYVAVTNVTAVSTLGDGSTTTIGTVDNGSGDASDATICASGCNSTPDNAGVSQNQIEVSGNYYTIQPYTTLTLNGASTTLSSALDHAIAYVNVVGNGDNVTNIGNDDGNPPNVTAIAFYQNTVTGSVQSVTIENGAVTSFVLEPSSGASQTYAADDMFQDNSYSVTAGSTVTIALDQAGEAATILSSNLVSAPTVALVTGTGSTTTVGGGTTNTAIVNDTNGGGQTLSLYSSYSVGTNQVYSSTYYQAPSISGGNDGLIVFEVDSAGYAVAPSTTTPAPHTLPTAMTAVTVADLFGSSAASNGDTLHVYSQTGSSVVLGAYDTNGNLDYTNTGGNPFFSIVNGDAFKESDGSYLGFGGLSTGTGHDIGVWRAQNVQITNGTATFYAIVSNQ